MYISPWSRFELLRSVVIGTDCIVSYKSFALIELNGITTM